MEIFAEAMKIGKIVLPIKIIRSRENIENKQTKQHFIMAH